MRWMHAKLYFAFNKTSGSSAKQPRRSNPFDGVPYSVLLEPSSTPGNGMTRRGPISL